MPESSSTDHKGGNSHEGARKSKSAADYPQLKELEKELVELLGRKKQVDRSLANVESMIYQFEGSYLQESAHGNIVRGFDQYLQSRPVGTTVTAGTRNRHSGAGVGGGTGAGTNNGRVTESERIFSHSSTTYRKAVGLADEEDYTSTTAISTRPSSPSSGDERPGAVLPSGVESSAVSRRSSSSTTASQQQRTHRPIAVSGDDMEDTAMHRANQEEDTTNRTLKRIRLSTHGRGPSNGGGGATNPESEGELDI